MTLTAKWDDAFANMAHIPGSEALPAQWARDAAAFRASGVAISEHVYGPVPRARMDLVLPKGPPRGLAVFVHGGYWMRLSKDDWTHLAQGAVDQGWAVCLPSYTLSPEARIRAITRQIASAITHAAGLVSGPIALCGHSAGGHLVARMICADTPLPTMVADRVQHTLAISGVYDLRPLLHTTLNATLALDLPEASAESPALLMPRGIPRVTAWVGGAERPEFLRQTQVFAQIWAGLDAQITPVIDAAHDHFSVLDALCDAQSRLTQAFVGTPR